MFGISSLGTISIKEIGSTISTPKLFQLYFHKDRGLMRQYGRPDRMLIDILRMMLQDELKAQATAAKADEVLVAHGRGAEEALNGIETPRQNAAQCI